MADTLKQMYKNTLGTVSSALYTVPVSTTTIMKEIILTNKTGTNQTVTIDIGGTQIISGLTIPPGNPYKETYYTVIPAGTSINGLASLGASIDCTISGVEVQ